MRDYGLFLVAGSLLGAYGVWAIRRDLKRGRASARGFGFDKVTQPRRYRALMAFNCVAVALVLIGTVVSAATLLNHAFSN
ncbi:MAG: hypothetical protein JWM33_1791 [Caulobacteraceae bacterium]|nr:hypothetical protein [Caulobacteraceae bacterium]